MRALVVDPEPNVKDVSDPEPGEGEALVRVLMAGICGTDLELLAGYKHFEGIPGHEMVGMVEESTDPSWVGARVVPEINIACGTCTLCREGLRKHCENRQVLGIIGRSGAFAERVAVPLENLHRVPDSVADEEAVWTELLAAALGVWDVGIQTGDPVLVLGDGRLGALVAMGLEWRGAKVELVGRDDDKLRALEALGVTVNRRDSRPTYPWVVESTGSVQGLDAALAWTKPTGTIVVKSTCHEPLRIDVARIVVDEIRLIGSRCGAFPPALDALASGRIPVRKLISNVFPFEEAKEALAESSRPGVFKVLLDFRPQN
jgi:2-desacetyl-2-hydroxyethyl bacteriochlorophyllide A dehydrogenase